MATCMKTLFCMYPSLGKLSSILLLLNNAVLFVLPGYLTCLHKNTCVSLFLNVKLTEIQCLIDYHSQGLEVFGEGKTATSVDWVQHVVRARISFKKWNLERKNEYWKLQYSHFVLFLSVFLLLCPQRQNSEDRQALQHFHASVWGQGQSGNESQHHTSCGKAKHEVHRS